MAADSRLTLNTRQDQSGQQVLQLAVGQTDSVRKLFVAPDAVGIATYGAADIQGVPIAGYVDSFVQECLNPPLEVDAVPQVLLEYFRALPGPPATWFHVAGYKLEQGSRSQHMWVVDVARNTVQRVNQPDQQGAQWGGEVDVLSRLISPVFVRDAQGAYQAVPTFGIPWQFFTLQDAIDFAAFGMRATIESMRFQTRARTVGGPVDIVVLKPDSVEWVARSNYDHRPVSAVTHNIRLHQTPRAPSVVPARGAGEPARWADENNNELAETTLPVSRLSAVVRDSENSDRG